MTNENNDTVENKKPTYTIMLLRSTEGKRRYPTRIGVTFTTKKGNQRALLDIIPASFELRDCEMILVPYKEESDDLVS